MDAAPRPQRVTLSRDLSEFLVEFSIAVQKHGLYPGGHPSLDATAASLARRAGRLLETRPTLVFGVALRQLIIDGVATDPDHPVLRRLAEGLHRHHLGAVSLSQGVGTDDLGQALRALSSEVERDGALGLSGSGRELSWGQVRLHPLTFDRLELVDEDEHARESDQRPAELWVGLARAAMASDIDSDSAPVPTEPSLVAKAIDERHGAEAYDQVIVGYLLQIARELKTASAAEAAVLRRRTSQLIRALRPETLRRLVQMGGDAAQRREFVLNAAMGMSVEAVVDIVKAAADANGQSISHGLVRMLTKLADHAELGHETVRPLADGALREQVGRLLTGWQLDDPNPELYREVLQHLATATPPRAPSGALDPEAEEDALRIVQMGLEVDECGPIVVRAIDALIAAGKVSTLVQMVAAAPESNAAARDAVTARLSAPGSIASLVRREPVDARALDQVFPSISLEGYAVLLDALAASTSRSTRRKLIDRLATTELDVGALVVSRLEDERWYVVRNMLVLLQRLGRVPPGFSALRWMDHQDLRVRYDAIRLSVTIPAERDTALRRALEGRDVSILRLGLNAVQHACPPRITPLVAAVAVDAEIAEELRALAVRVLGHAREKAARDALLTLVDGGRTMLGRPRLAPPSRIAVAAVRALSQGWRADRAVTPILVLAAASSDPEFRRAAQSSEAP
jgi:hypothetical protein